MDTTTEESSSANPVVLSQESIGMKAALISSSVNVILAFVKIVSGIIGNSYALIADGVESTLDIISSIIVWGGLKIAAEPPDDDHPYGHGKAESLAGVIVSFILIIVGIGICYHGVYGIIHSDGLLPESYTIVVLIAIIVIKEVMFHYTLGVALRINSTSMKAEAWHHRSDALTSFAALVGVSIAIYFNIPAADEYAALVGGLIILYNGGKIFKFSINEVMDSSAPENITIEMRKIILQHSEVREVSNCRIRKSGLKYLVHVDLQVDPNISVLKGHEIAHEIEDDLLKHSEFSISDIIIHVEPFLEESGDV
ncbi:MAG: cation-efflux pump [Planctomycetota bacterium]|nr:MAG: cation-efflux pump [Planctomycetota bacterium]